MNMFGTDRCLLRLLSVFGRIFKIRSLRPSQHLHTVSAYSPRTLSADRSHTMFVSTATWRVRSVSGGTCAGYWLAAFVTGEKKPPKLRKFCGRGRSAWHSLLRELHVEGGLGFRNFIWITKSSFEISPQKIGPSIQRKDTKFREAIPLWIGLSVTLRYLANSDLLVNFSSAAFVFTGNIICRVAFLITVFVSAQCTVHTLALDRQSTIKVRQRVNR